MSLQMVRKASLSSNFAMFDRAENTALYCTVAIMSRHSKIEDNNHSFTLMRNQNAEVVIDAMSSGVYYFILQNDKHSHVNFSLETREGGINLIDEDTFVDFTQAGSSKIEFAVRLEGDTQYIWTIQNPNDSDEISFEYNFEYFAEGSLTGKHQFEQTEKGSFGSTVWVNMLPKELGGNTEPLLKAWINRYDVKDFDDILQEIGKKKVKKSTAKKWLKRGFGTDKTDVKSLQSKIGVVGTIPTVGTTVGKKDLKTVFYDFLCSQQNAVLKKSAENYRKNVLLATDTSVEDREAFEKKDLGLGIEIYKNGRVSVWTIFNGDRYSPDISFCGNKGAAGVAYSLVDFKKFITT